MNKDARKRRLPKKHPKPHKRTTSSPTKDMKRPKVDSDLAMIKCRKCGQINTESVTRCRSCDKSLRPILLSVLTLIGLLSLLVSIIGLMFWSEKITKETSIVILMLLLNACGIVITLGIRYGCRWAWIGIHILWAFNIGILFIPDLIPAESLGFFTVNSTVVVILLSLYLQTKRVRTFCSVKENDKKFAVLFIVAILAAIPFSLGKYCEFNSPGPFDSGAYVYSAKHILDGAVIGVDEKPSAQLGTLLVNMLGVKLFGFSETGPKLIQGILQAAALVLMFIAIYKLFGTLPAAVSVIVASTYLSAPLIAKFGNVKEQYMIAFMVMAISCFVMRQLGGRWWWAVLAGAFVIWAPLFKPTGMSAIGALGLFVVMQPLLKNMTFKQTGIDILLLLAGAAIGIGPLYIWLIGWNVKMGLPYAFVWTTLAKFLPAAPAAGQPKTVEDYVSAGRKLVTFSQQWPIVLRYYAVLILPIALAVGAILARTFRMIRNIAAKNKKTIQTRNRIVLLFAVWWLLDMAFIWISPRSYEQYYLPLTASAAMLGGYLIGLYTNLLANPVNKNVWRIVGIVGLLFMIGMSWHIFFGIEKSPHTGFEYGEKRRGYSQRLREISRNRRENLKGPWEIVGQYIRLHSTPDDKIYVWGWFPGIYVQAQRFSPTAHAVMMPRPTPQVFKGMITQMLTDFEREKPKFIVDSRKRHVPMNRPPYELWPIWLKDFMGAKESRFLSLDKREIAQYDAKWSEFLSKQFDEDEALRYKALKPFRDFVMNNYRIVRMFGQHVLFELKKPAAN